MTDRPNLRSLADRLGILPGYIDVTGVYRETKDSARVALLAAMGLDASTEIAAGRALTELDRARGQCLLAPVRVVVADAEQRPNVRLNIPGHDPSTVEWRIELHEESGGLHVAEGRMKSETSDLSGHDPHDIQVPLPANPPPGYHAVRVAVDLPPGVLEAEQSFIVSPGRCVLPYERLGDRRAFGIWANLYTLRSDRNWGIGDLTDLRDLACQAAAQGATFVGLSPLHALRNYGEWIGPYLPLSRLFRNLLYLDIEAVPEFSQCQQARTLFESPAFQAELSEARQAPSIDYQRAAELKTKILRLMHATFVEKRLGGASQRARAYTEYVASKGRALLDYATFVALDSWLTRETAPGHDRSDWPTEYRRPDSPQVEAFRAACGDEIEFHCFTQFELDRQLAGAAQAARQAGMPLGLYTDLALGSAADGSDAWGFPDLFVSGVQVGAPPDPFCEVGQTWGFPPADPRHLRQTRYEYWIQLLRSSLAHAGMLRIDHIPGLFRQFWVPKGLPAADAAYVAYPAEDLLGILALESRRHDAVIVGEDLGTVPPEVGSVLERWGILSSRVMYFERDHEGRFNPSGSYSPRALVTATTHDHPPLAGFWSGRDLEIRRQIGWITSNDEWNQAQGERRWAREALLLRLLEEGLPFDMESGSPEELCAAVYAFLARTPAPLVGISLDDLAGETDPVNLPGVPLDQHRSWSRRMTRKFSDILSAPSVRAILDEVRARLDEPRHQ